MATCPTIDPTKPLAPPPLPSIDFVLKNGSNSVTYSIPWPTFAAQSGVASGGNRYYRETRPADPKDPLIARIFVGMSAISQKHFKDYFGAGQDHASMKMSDVLSTYAGKLATSFGIVSVPVMPIPSEKASAFVARGGYLLWTDPQTGVFTGNVTLQSMGPGSDTTPWLLGPGAPVTGVKQFDLFAFYYPSSKTVVLNTRLAYDSAIANIMDRIGAAFQWALTKACALITNDKLTAAAAFAALYPKALPEVALWTTAATLCNKAFPVCTPAVPTTPTALTPAYPVGSIAWYDKATGQYRVAVPTPVLAGFNATYTETVPSVVLPTGVALVSYWKWQSVTQPFFKRTSFLIGAGSTFLFGVGLTAIAIRRHRHHNA